MANLSIDFSQIEDLANKLEAKSKSVKPYCEEAMQHAFDEVTRDIESSSSAHYRTHGANSMEQALIKNAEFTWQGDILTVPAGYDFDYKGALHSVFNANGTGKRVRKDKKCTGSMPMDGAMNTALNKANMKEKAVNAVRDTLTDKLAEVLRG